MGEDANFDRIVMNVLPQLINGHTPERQTILSVLRQVAESMDGDFWTVKKSGSGSENPQLPLFVDIPAETKALPELFTPTTEDVISHNSIIYRLIKLGRAAGYLVWVGKKEQTAIFNGEKLSDLSVDSFLPETVGTYNYGAVIQIDVIWLDTYKQPKFAFEIEHSTTVKSALERFVEILKVRPYMAGNLVILAPSKRVNKINKELTQSAFIGHPLYMETKVKYAFYDDFLALYQSLATSSFKRQDIIDKLNAIMRRPVQKQNDN